MKSCNSLKMKIKDNIKKHYGIFTLPKSEFLSMGLYRTRDPCNIPRYILKETFLLILHFLEKIEDPEVFESILPGFFFKKNDC